MLEYPEGKQARRPAVNTAATTQLGGSEYERHRGAVLAMLGKQFPRFDTDQRLEVYHEAWALALKKRASGERVHNLRAYLMRTAACEAMNLVTHQRPSTPLEPGHPALLALTSDEFTPEEQVVIDDQARICREVIDALSPRHRAVFKLRWDAHLEPPEIRKALALSQRQYKRLAKEGTMAIAERVAERDDGTWSRRQRSLLAACLTGIATSEQRAEASRRLAADPHVAALCRELHTAVGRAAAMLPLPVVLQGPSGLRGRLGELLSSVKAQVAELVGSGKQQATALYVRAADPTPLAAALPGAVVATVAGCIAIGTGATYCVTEGVPDALRSPLGIAQTETRAQQPPEVLEPDVAAPVSAPALEAPDQAGPAAPPEEVVPKDPPQAGGHEFRGIEMEPAPSPAPQTPAPEPQPARPTDEFTGFEK